MEFLFYIFSLLLAAIFVYAQLRLRHINLFLTQLGKLIFTFLKLVDLPGRKNSVRNLITLTPTRSFIIRIKGLQIP